MATEKQCPFYPDCGFVKWRKECPDAHISPLPDNGDCGIEIYDCLRNKLKEAPSTISFTVDTYGPIGDTERHVGFPDRFKKKDGSPRSLAGGGYKD